MTNSINEKINIEKFDSKVANHVLHLEHTYADKIRKSRSEVFQQNFNSTK